MKKTIAGLLAAVTMCNLQAGNSMKSCCSTKAECTTKKTDACCKTDKSCKDECVTTCATKTTSKRTRTASGLEYEVLKANPNGSAVKKGDTVKAHYTGWLADKDGNPIMDKKFDSSVDRGEPFSVKAGAGMVILGWDETLLDMKVGEKRRIVLAPHLAYGNRAVGRIPANSTLVFDLEILSVQ